MGKWLQRLQDFDSNEEKCLIPLNDTPTKPAKALLYPFDGVDIKEIEKNTEEEDDPSDQEIAESHIDCLRLRDDRIFVRQCLVGLYGSKRLALVKLYLEQWQIGSDAEPIQFKKGNAGRHRANVWLREKFEHE